MWLSYIFYCMFLYHLIGPFSSHCTVAAYWLYVFESQSCPCIAFCPFYFVMSFCILSDSLDVHSIFEMVYPISTLLHLLSNQTKISPNVMDFLFAAAFLFFSSTGLQMNKRKYTLKPRKNHWKHFQWLEYVRIDYEKTYNVFCSLVYFCFRFQCYFTIILQYNVSEFPSPCFVMWERRIWTLKHENIHV